MSNDIFHFSVNVIELQPIHFLACHFFCHFYPKIDANAYFSSVFSNNEWFNRKTKDTVRFFTIKIRISIIFMHLRSKLTSEIGPKIGGLDRKTKQNRLK